MASRRLLEDFGPLLKSTTQSGITVYVPITDAVAYFYTGGTTTPLTVYTNTGLSAGGATSRSFDVNGRPPTDIFVSTALNVKVRIIGDGGAYDKTLDYYAQSTDVSSNVFDALTDPGADRLGGWDESDNAGSWFSFAGNALAFSGKTITTHVNIESIANAGTIAADKFAYYSGSNSAALADVTSFARTLLDDASATAACTTLGAATLATAQTFTARQVFRNTSSTLSNTSMADAQFLWDSTNTGAVGPFLVAYHNSSSPAANDIIYTLGIWGKDSAGNDENYGYITHTVTDPTNGSEDSRWTFVNLVASAGNTVIFQDGISTTGPLLVQSGTAVPAGGTAGAGLKMSSTSNFGVFFGSGAPTLVAAKGSLYLRSDGSSTSTRMYVATDSAGAWTAVTTAT